MTKPTIERLASMRYSFGSSYCLWKKTTSTGKRLYVVGPKSSPPARGWSRTMEAAVRRHREGGSR